MVKIALVLIIAIVLSACAGAGSRDVAGDFISINGGQISKANVLEFVECVSDKFRDRQIGLDVNLLNRQQRRNNGYRVELVTNSTGLAISADIFDDGRVELFERTTAIRTRLEDERKGFAICLDKYKIVQ